MGRVSYNQFSIWSSCPYRWKLSYKDNLSKFKDNIHVLFGTSVHHVLQEYLQVMYGKSIAEADRMDLDTMLQEKMRDVYLEAKAKDGFEDFTNKIEMLEFYNHGVEIISFFKKHRSEYFLKKNYSLVGVEVPIDIKIKENVNFIGYIDVAIKNDLNGDIYIYDFKTSTHGWNAEAKKNESKISQLILYKKYYAEQYNVDIKKIHIEFLILKRKLYDNVEFPQKRIQRFEPSNGTPTINKVSTKFNKFVSECFDDNGDFSEYPHKKTPSDFGCKYCEYNNLPELCDKRGE